MRVFVQSPLSTPLKHILEVSRHKRSTAGGSAARCKEVERGARAIPPTSTRMRGIVRRLICGPNRMLAAFGVVFAGSIVVLFLVDLNAGYRDAIAVADRQTRSFAQELAE